MEIYADIKCPGYFIKEEIYTRGWSHRHLASIAGMSLKQVDSILYGKSSINTDMAKALGTAFNVSPKFFSNLQVSYNNRN